MTPNKRMTKIKSQVKQTGLTDLKNGKINRRKKEKMKVKYPLKIRKRIKETNRNLKRRKSSLKKDLIKVENG
tara:strand:+ start:309 stop:524 length:216 start_codon:yes stop_codon:yes gene_type:complete